MKDREGLCRFVQKWFCSSSPLFPCTCGWGVGSHPRLQPLGASAFPEVCFPAQSTDPKWERWRRSPHHQAAQHTVPLSVCLREKEGLYEAVCSFSHPRSDMFGMVNGTAHCRAQPCAQHRAWTHAGPLCAFAFPGYLSGLSPLGPTAGAQRGLPGSTQSRTTCG